MFKYTFLFLFIFLSIFSKTTYAEKVEFYVSDNTPASIINSGIPTYFFLNDKIGVFKYGEEKFYYGSEVVANVSSIKDISSIAKTDRKIENLIFIPNGTARFISVENDDFSCKWDPMQNCLYSDTIITSIETKNIIGKKNMKEIDNTISLKEDTLVFPIGSKVYKFETQKPVFEFEDFEEFSSLVCSKNVDNMCRGVVSNGVIDKVALFELIQGNGSLSNVYFSHSKIEDLAYVYDLERMIVYPYSLSCIENANSHDELEKCSLSNKFPNGNITEKVHKKTGVVYWVVDYKNPNMDNLIFLVNSFGEPFKIFTNPYSKTYLNMYNEMAAEVIFNKMWNK